ncbi:MAG: hypothetical protein OEW73_02940 [Gammaproteobacteria bacterium]|jgi:hypothetical protein|nr:hypothetical protein [Gammaproteobacteria bacterium]MDH5261854.1 hypothetical protein [Gammaproteobacteria bacterium]MDH5583422.1 hypothetical protein [Gammaproteobacteria bacterium]
MKMLKIGLRFNEYVSLAVMILMVVALVAGQADASTDNAEPDRPVSPISALVDRSNDDRIHIDFDGQLGDSVLKFNIAVATDLSHFRGEDE